MSSTGTAEEPFDRDSARAEWEKEAKKLGRFNLAIFGKTGVGKSTLVNAIFGEEVAGPGSASRSPSDSHLYLTRTGSLGLYDTKGIEIGTSADEVLAEVQAFVESKRTADASEHIHIAYYCIRAGAHRIEPSEMEFIRGLHGLGAAGVPRPHPGAPTNGVIRPEHLQFAEHLARSACRSTPAGPTRRRRCRTPSWGSRPSGCTSCWRPPTRRCRSPRRPRWPPRSGSTGN